jgi:hypothetical protein
LAGKVYGFLEIVAKTVINGNPPAAGRNVKLCQETHQLLSNSMIERPNPHHKGVTFSLIKYVGIRGMQVQFTYRKGTPIDRDPYDPLEWLLSI